MGPHCPIDLETSKKFFFLSLLVISVYAVSMGDKYNAFIYLYGPVGPVSRYVILMSQLALMIFVNAFYWS